MLDSIISLLAPHACLSCNRTGNLLCSDCELELIDSRTSLCIGCGEENEFGVCGKCKPDWPVDGALVFGERSGALKVLIDEYKYGHKRAAASCLARLAGSMLPYGIQSARIVPVPTVAGHIRARGYDHAALLAQNMAHLTRLSYAPLLIRRTASVQHGASKKARISQAKTAFRARKSVDPDPLYIVIDDIVTTGSSLRAAANELRVAGAPTIWVLALARQPLDTTIYRNRRIL